MAAGRSTLVGTVVAGRYRLVEPLARGGSGAVYRALQLPIEREVAIKVLRTDLDADSAAHVRQRFLREAELASRLRHPHIVTYLDAGVDDEQPFVVMELLRGRTLKQAIKAGPLSADETARLGAALAGALHHAHGRGLIHRDIKPGNVFLIPDDDGVEQPVLVDFGLVRDTEALDVTRATLTMGTPPYMSPEQVDDGPLGAASDVYGLGVLLFKMITGVLPFEGGSSMRMALAHLQEPVPAMADRAPGVAVDPRVEALVRRMLHKAPDDRPTAVEVARALEGIAEGAGGGAVSGAAPPESAASSKVGWRAIGGLGLVTLAGAVGFWWTVSGEERASEAPVAAEQEVWLDLRDDTPEDPVQQPTTAGEGGEASAASSRRVPHDDGLVEAADAGAAEGEQGDEGVAEEQDLGDDGGSARDEAPRPAQEPVAQPPAVKPKEAPAPRSTPDPPAAPVEIEGLTLATKHAERMLAFINTADRETLALAGVYSKGVYTIVDRRPFADLASFAATRGIGPSTLQAIAEETGRGYSASAEQEVQRTEDGRALYDGVAFGSEHATRALAWVNAASEEALIAAGIYDQGAKVITRKRPFGSMQELAHTPSIGARTMERVHDATEQP